MNSLISVIVPIYNVEEYLSRCIESIINQTYKNLEIILVDDGSQDNCPKICDDYASRDNRIKVIHKKNGGLSEARNVGMKVATGEYISFVDSDDWIDINTYSLVLKKMIDTNSQIGAFNFVIAKNEDIVLDLSEKHKILNSKEAIENTIDDIDVKTVVWNKIYHYTVLKDLYFREGKYNEDEFFTFYALSNAERIVYLCRQFYFYFQRSNSIMGVYNIKRLDMLEGVKERMDFIKTNYPEIYIKAKLSFSSCCIYHYQMLLKNKKVDINNTGKKKVMALRSSVKVNRKEIKDSRIVDKFSHIMANSWLGMELLCRLRNLISLGL